MVIDVYITSKELDNRMKHHHHPQPLKIDGGNKLQNFCEVVNALHNPNQGPKTF